MMIAFIVEDNSKLLNYCLSTFVCEECIEKYEKILCYKTWVASAYSSTSLRKHHCSQEQRKNIIN